MITRFLEIHAAIHPTPEPLYSFVLFARLFLATPSKAWHCLLIKLCILCIRSADTDTQTDDAQFEFMVFHDSVTKSAIHHVSFT